MLKKLSVIALILMFSACQSKQKTSDLNAEEQVKIDDQIIEESSYQTVANEQQAKALNEGQIETIKEVEVQDRVFFDYNSSSVGSEAAKILDVQAAWLKDSPQIKISIEGHCDERGTREYNIALGEKRAMAVKNYLIKAGIDASRMQTISYGKEHPAYFGSTEDVFAKNRRAVVVVMGQ